MIVNGGNHIRAYLTGVPDAFGQGVTGWDMAAHSGAGLALDILG